MEDINVFIGGMNSDDSKTSQKSNTYSDAWNVTLVTEEGGSNGTLVNVKGTSTEVSYPTSTPQYTIGWGVIRNTLYLFTTAVSGSNDGTIWKVIFDELTGIATTTLLYTHVDLNFNKDYPIGEAVGVFETPGIQRLYWTDNLNDIRVINTAAGDISTLTINDISLNSASSLTTPRIIGINQTEGFLNAGIYYYTYRLRGIDGELTNWSQPIGPVNIVEQEDTFESTEDNVEYHEGGEPHIEPIPITSKAVEIRAVDVDHRQYSTIEFAYLYKNDVGSPIATAWIYETASASATHITSLHTKSHLFEEEDVSSFVELTIEEITVENLYVSKAKTLATKDGRLFAGNVTEASFEILDEEFDARVVRYDKNGNKITGINAPGQNITDFSCRNNSDKQFTYKYLSDKSTMGAEGPNIKITFGTADIVMEDELNADVLSFASSGGIYEWLETSESGLTYKPKLPSVGNDYVPVDDTSYQMGEMFRSNKHPGKALYMRGYQRGEFYRFGIVFYDKSGASSFVKWIGDIKMPEVYDGEQTSEEYRLAETVSTGGNGNSSVCKPLHLNIEVNIPTIVKAKISGYSIVRVKRTQTDKTILGQGIISPVQGPLSNVQDNAPNTTPPKDYGIKGASSKYRYYPPGVRTHADVTDPEMDGDLYGVGTFQEYISREQYKASITGNSIKTILPEEDAFTFESPDFQYKTQHFLSTDYMRVVACLRNESFRTDPQINFGTWSSLPRYLLPVNNTSGVKYADVLDRDLFFNTSSLTGAPSPTNAWGAYATRSRAYLFETGPDGARNIINLEDTVNVNRGGNSGAQGSLSYSNHYEFANHHCTTLFCKAKENTNLGLKYNNYSRFLVNYIRERAEQYNGNTDEIISGNTFISCNHYQKITDSSPNVTTSNVYGGDTYVNWNSLVKTYLSPLNASGGKTGSYVALSASGETVEFWHEDFGDTSCYTFPVESTMNLDLRNNDVLQKYGIGAQNGPQALGNILTVNRVGETFDYNELYSDENDIQIYLPKYFDFEINSSFDTKIHYTNKKINGSNIDTWSTFQVDDAAELDNQYGPLNRLIVFKDGLYAFQDRGVSYISVDPRAVAIDGDESSIVLGSGTAIDNITYITNNSGSKHRWAVVPTDNLLYYFDVLQKKIKAISGKSVVDVDGMNGFLRDWIKEEMNNNDTPIGGISTIGSYDSTLGELMFTFRQTDLENVGITPPYINNLGDSTWKKNYVRTLVYNEKAQAFTSFYSIDPHMYITMNGKMMYTMGNEFGANILKHGGGDYNNFNGAYYDSNVEIINNQKASITKTFDNYGFLLEVKDEDGNFPQEKTLDSIKCENDYQHTGDVDLTYKGNVMKKNQEFSLAIPRNIVKTDFDESKSLSDPSNQDSTRTFKERMKSKYLRSRFYWRDRLNTKMMLHYIKLFYRENIR